MKVLVVCHAFGGKTPTGNINKRIIEKISESCDIKVITTIDMNEDICPDSQIVRLNTWPCRPTRVFSKLGDIIGRDVEHFFWELRAIREIDRIINNWKPDIVYARGQPLSPLRVGRYASNRFNVPLFVHFSDPIPAPIEWKPSLKYRKKMINGISKVLNDASKISFVTKEMSEYQQEVTGVNIRDRSFVSSNPITDLSVRSEISNIPITKKDDSKIKFLFLGTFYGNRKPDSLLRAFKCFSDNNSSATLEIVGNNNHLKGYEVDGVIKISPFSTKPFDLIMNADVLIDVDSSSEKEVFLSSKLLDYLSVDKPILSITSLNSPAAQLLATLDKSTVVVRHDVDEIIDGLKKVLLMKSDNEAKEQRDQVRDKYSDVVIAGEIIAEIGKFTTHS